MVEMQQLERGVVDKGITYIVVVVEACGDISVIVPTNAIVIVYFSGWHHYQNFCHNLFPSHVSPQCLGFVKEELT
jgi:hypothetical protein